MKRRGGWKPADEWCKLVVWSIGMCGSGGCWLLRGGWRELGCGGGGREERGFCNRAQASFVALECRAVVDG